MAIFDTNHFDRVTQIFCLILEMVILVFQCQMSEKIYLLRLLDTVALSMVCTESPENKSQYAERILNKTAKAINETITGLKLMLQDFRIYFV